MKMTTEVLIAEPRTILFNALHFAFYSEYVSRDDTLDAFLELSPDFPCHRFNEFHESWRLRHGVTK